MAARSISDNADVVHANAERAWQVVRAHLAPTPLIPTALAGGALLKAETFQPIGAFKVRGALAAVDAAPPGRRLVTPSAGNHGLGMAFAAEALVRDVTVVVSRQASPAKVAALRQRSIELVEYGDSYDDAEAHALALAGDTDSDITFVSGYDDVHVIAGATTIGRELDEQITDPVDGPLTVITPLGGGGLTAGLALWAERRSAPTRVIGVEAAVSTAMSATLAAGHDVTVEVGDTLADGLAGNLARDAMTPALLRGRVHAVVQVSEAEIRTAMGWLAGHHGLVVEGAAAVGVAALLTGRIAGDDILGQPVVVLTGRNIDLATYAGVLSASDAPAPGR